MLMTGILEKTGMDKLRKGSLCIFAGAGISFASGIPMVYQIKRYILGLICDDEADRELLLSAPLPFEAFIEILFNNYIPSFGLENADSPEDIGKAVGEVLAAAHQVLHSGQENAKPNIQMLHSGFFKLFDDARYRPNQNHYFIAQLLHKGICSFAVTTNFDTMIEQAYKEVAGRELPVYFPEADGRKLRFITPCLFKLHGGCQKLSTIQTTLDTIVSSEATGRCKEMVEHTFTKNRHARVLVMGYSFSDVFDITPALLSLRGSRKAVININHSQGGPQLHPIAQRQPVFGRMHGWQVDADTDAVVEALWVKHLPGVPYRRVQPSSVRPEDVIGGWAQNLSQPHQRHFLCGLYLATVENLKRAAHYFGECLKTPYAQKNEDYREMAARNQRKALSGRIVAPAMPAAERAGPLEQVQDLVDSVTGFLLSGDTKGAEKACEKALALARKAHHLQAEGMACGSFAHVLNELGRPKEAIVRANRALVCLAADNDISTLKLKCRVYCYLSTAYDTLGNTKRHRENLDKGIALAEKIGAQNEIASVYFNLASSVLAQGNDNATLRKSIDRFKLGYAFCTSEEVHQQFLSPMMMHSAFCLMGINIVSLWLEDHRGATLVTREELQLANKLLRDEYEQLILLEFRPVLVHVASSASVAALALHEWRAALDIILDTIIKVTGEDAPEQDAQFMLTHLGLWITIQEEMATGKLDFEKEKERLSGANAPLGKAVEHAVEHRYGDVALCLKEAFTILPTDCRYKDSVSYYAYERLCRLRDLMA